MRERQARLEQPESLGWQAPPELLARLLVPERDEEARHRVPALRRNNQQGPHKLAEPVKQAEGLPVQALPEAVLPEGLPLQPVQGAALPMLPAAVRKPAALHPAEVLAEVPAEHPADSAAERSHLAERAASMAVVPAAEPSVVPANRLTGQRNHSVEPAEHMAAEQAVGHYAIPASWVAELPGSAGLTCMLETTSMTGMWEPVGNRSIPARRPEFPPQAVQDGAARRLSQEPRRNPQIKAVAVLPQASPEGAVPQGERGHAPPSGMEPLPNKQHSSTAPQEQQRSFPHRRLQM